MRIRDGIGPCTCKEHQDDGLMTCTEVQGHIGNHVAYGAEDDTTSSGWVEWERETPYTAQYMQDDNSYWRNE